MYSIPPPVPKKVKLAVYILIGTFVLGIINAILRKVTTLSVTVNPVFFITIGIVLMAFNFFIVYKIYNRKNWARIVLFILLLCGIYALFFKKDKALPILHSLSIFELTAQIIAAILLLSKESATWFSERTRKIEEMVAEIGTDKI